MIWDERVLKMGIGTLSRYRASNIKKWFSYLHGELISQDFLRSMMCGL